jgi:hypothetical protein
LRSSLHELSSKQTSGCIYLQCLLFHCLIERYFGGFILEGASDMDRLAVNMVMGWADSQQLEYRCPHTSQLRQVSSGQVLGCDLFASPELSGAATSVSGALRSGNVCLRRAECSFVLLSGVSESKQIARKALRVSPNLSAQNRWLKRRMTSQPLRAEENITIHGEQIETERRIRV